MPHGHRLAVLAAAFLCGCATVPGANDKEEFEDLGLVASSSEPPPGVLIPVADGDLPAVSERGRLLQRMERALVLAYEQGVTRVGGVPAEDVVLPLVDVDPGGQSAQVMFVRWHGKAKAALDPAEAERWLLVSILMDPDRVLDVELLAGQIGAGSHFHRRVQTQLAAARTLAKVAPGDLFHLLDLYERADPADAKSEVRGHVYAFSADGDAADVEVVVDPPKKKKPPEVRSSRTVHPKGRGSQSPIVVFLPQPAPLTVARAMLMGPDAGQVLVMAAGEAQWTVSAASGEIEAAGAAPGR